jgi:hypothetical protein
MLMLKFTDKDREQLAEIKHGWFSLAVLAVLLFGPIFIEDSFGQKWRVIATAVAVAVWFAIRPWRFGLLPEKSRRDMRLVGSVIICLVLFGEAFNYFV